MKVHRTKSWRLESLRTYKFKFQNTSKICDVSRKIIVSLYKLKEEVLQHNIVIKEELEISIELDTFLELNKKKKKKTTTIDTILSLVIISMKHSYIIKGGIFILSTFYRQHCLHRPWRRSSEQQQQTEKEKVASPCP